MKVICKENFDLPFIIGKEYNAILDDSNYPLIFKVMDESGELSPFSDMGLNKFFDIIPDFKFGI